MLNCYQLVSLYIYLHWFYTEPKNYFFEFYYNFLLVVQCFGEGLWVSDDLEVQVKYRWASKVNPVLVLNVQLRWNNTYIVKKWLTFDRNDISFYLKDFINSNMEPISSRQIDKVLDFWSVHLDFKSCSEVFCWNVLIWIF